MEFMKANDIRRKFLEFFESKGHYVKESFSLVPKNDKSLLLINAGMAPLKNYFLGIEEPPAKRMTTCQKCVRTGDIENIGHTLRHATFFEMLGNFSFGDYFKKDATAFAYEFVTKVLKMDEDKIYVTVYEDDDEAFNIWKDNVGIREDKLVRLGKEDNFWEIGNGGGPCGPCSELYIDRGEKYGCKNPDCKPGCDCDRFLEFWNLVFTQFDKQKDGSLKPLEHPNIDTGMGLERIACIMQNVDSIFDIDTIKDIRDKVCEIANKKYQENDKDDISIRIVTDHVRAVTFLISDGIVPSNEGRGYVLRRLIRRAVRHGKLIGINSKFLCELVDAVINSYEDGYKELREKEDYIKKIVSSEEDKFFETIESGIEILNSYMEKIKGEKIISGDVAFKLYDTYGFPLELTVEIAKDKGYRVDEKGFNEKMEIQRQTARENMKKGSDIGWKDEISSLELENKETEFLGYEKLQINENISDIIFNGEVVNSINSKDLKDDDVFLLIFSKTPFYAQQGGQVGDIGQVILENGKNFNVVDTKKSTNGLYVHYCQKGKDSFSIKKTDKVQLKVNREFRLFTRRNHTATHLLHKALKMVLGDHVKQAGSLVAQDRLRFDFNHFQALTPEEIEKVEKVVNDAIKDSLDVTTEVMDIEEAKNSGAVSLFDEKYGNTVRVLSIGDFSKEFCGGTHAINSSEIGMFKILSESGVASGIRRIEAITGNKVYDYLLGKEKILKDLAKDLKSNENNLIVKANELINENKTLNKKLSDMEKEQVKGDIDNLLKSKEEINGINFVKGEFKNFSKDILMDTAQVVIDKSEKTVVLFSNVDEEKNKLNFLCMVTKDIMNKYPAGKIVKEAAMATGGNGGGRPNMAMAGGKDIDKIDHAFLKAKELIESI